MLKKIIDDFADISGWSALASGEARLELSQDRGPGGTALRLDFDFHGGGGFVVARKLFSLELPESYCFDFQIRGLAQENIFEFKLVDASNANVWRYRAETFAFPPEWRPLTIRNSQIEFAWGPLGGGPAQKAAAIEVVIAAGPGGKGTVWIGRISLQDTTYRAVPLAQASSALPGHEAHKALDPAAATGWRSAPVPEPQWLLIDFQAEREFGGLVITWEHDRQAREFNVQLSSDGHSWATAYATQQGASLRSYIYLPQTQARYIRLNLDRSAAGQGFGIQSVDIRPFDFSRTINHFFQNIAQEQPKGMYPKYFLKQQTYWTPVSPGEGLGQALFNEEGMVEVDKGTFSIEPFLYAEGRLITWADCALRQELLQNYLPLPSSAWQAGSLCLTVQACAETLSDRHVLFLCYRIANTAQKSIFARLFTAIRPFQVTPTWQNWRSFGGVCPVRDLALRNGAVWVNGTRAIWPLTPASGFGAAAFAQGPVTDYLLNGELPGAAEVQDAFGYASGALRFDLELDPGASQEVFLAIPFGTLEGLDDGILAELQQGISGAEQFARAMQRWQARLGAITLCLPQKARSIFETLQTAAAHILINRDGPALHPGPRRYARSWIRDGAIMGAALLRVGCTDALRDFIRWYSQFQASDGNVPDCADQEGTEWLPEFDAYGQFVYSVMEYYRFSNDRAFLAEMRPAIAKAMAYMEGLRQTRLTPEYQEPSKKACYGLLPESMSHEGYMAHPVHAYWDDFWGLRGFRDAANLAEALGDLVEAERLRSIGDAFAENVRASLAATISRHQIDFVPGSVELGDFDPTATSVAVGLLDQLQILPLTETNNAYDKYLAGFRNRAQQTIDWNNYTAYEIRIIGALVRLGRRAEALELLEFMLKDQRISAWHQWPEITWRDPRSPSFIGDLPHTWISAEYILSACSLFAYEQDADQSLVLAAGLAWEWLADGFEVGVRDLPTYYGRISYGMRLEADDTLRMWLQGELAVPPGGIRVRPPLERPLREIWINGRRIEDCEQDCFVCRDCPADVEAKCG